MCDVGVVIGRLAPLGRSRHIVRVHVQALVYLFIIKALHEESDRINR